jgi:serine/threonine protein kinase
LGFDDEGVLKLFDFGLAKELHESSKDEDGLYHMTGFTGAIRYMAPEVGLYQPYNLSADVYSWSMLFWYLLALQPPMGLYTPGMFLDRVFQRGHRPAMKESWPDDWTDLTHDPRFQKFDNRSKSLFGKLIPKFHPSCMTTTVLPLMIIMINHH